MRIIFLVLVVLGLFVGCKNKDNVQEENKMDQADMTHNSRNSLDWSGTYRGILPCADCEGIKTEVVLHNDETYEVARKYLGEGDTIFRENGNFEWNEGGSAIILSNGTEASEIRYKVGENRLIMLNADEEQVTGDLSEMYVLEKTGSDEGITERYWKLIELRGERIPAPETGRTEPHFVLRTGDNRVTGNSGCNVLMGSYKLEEANRIEFSKMASTMMACQEVEYENDFLSVFEEVEGYSIKGDILLFESADKAALAKFTAVYFH